MHHKARKSFLSFAFSFYYRLRFEAVNCKHFRLKLSLLILRNCPKVLVWLEETNGNLGKLVQAGIQVAIIAFESQTCF
jgi:hypothetical protein